MLNRGRACQDTKRDCAAEAVLDFTRLALERIKHHRHRMTGTICTKRRLDKLNFIWVTAANSHTVNAWAKGQLHILADMAEHRGMQWFADEARKIAGGLLHL